MRRIRWTTMALLASTVAAHGQVTFVPISGTPVRITYPLGGTPPSGSVVYDNTCPSIASCPPTWVGAPLCPGEQILSYGRIPATDTPSPVGVVNQYDLTFLEFGYASTQTMPPLDCEIKIWPHVQPCTHPSGPPAVTVTLSGLPGGTLEPTFCAVDLAALGVTPVSLLAEGDGSFDNDVDADSFGYTIEFTNLNNESYVLLAGDPTTCGFGAGTCFPTAPSLGCPSGTGLGSTDSAMFLCCGGVPEYCIDAGPTTHTSAYLQLYASDPCGPPVCDDQCPPPSSTTQAGLFLVNGLSNCIPWSWALSAPQLYLENLNAPGVCPAGSPAIALATAFAASINGKGCPGVQAFGFPFIPPDPTKAFLFVSVEGCDPFDLCVGPAGVAPTCCVGTGGTICSFNPDLSRVALSGEDCNGNGTDDLLDILLGTSADLNQNDVPDECEPGTLGCFGLGCPCNNDDPTAGCVNSTGAGARLTGFGSTSVASDDLVLTTTGCPPSNTGLYFMGGSTFSPVFVGDGLACTGGIWRYFPGAVDVAGVFVQSSPVANAFPGAINPGDTRHFQSWTRDVLCGPPPSPCPSPCGMNSNLSNVYSVTFTP